MNRSIRWYHVFGGILLSAFAIKFLDMEKAISGMSKKIDNIKYCTDNAYIPIPLSFWEEKMKLDHLEILAGFSELSEEEINDFMKRGWNYHPSLNTGGLYVMSIQYDRYWDEEEYVKANGPFEEVQR